MRIGIRDVSISPKSYVNYGLRLVESLRLGENWRQPNGHLKDMACRELLLTLNRKGLITLPPRLASANNDKRNRSIPVIEIDQTPLEEKLSHLPPVKLKLVRNTSLEPLYNSLVQQHHYLGYRQIVGLRLVEPSGA
jgi:hypothetical protein